VGQRSRQHHLLTRTGADFTSLVVASGAPAHHGHRLSARSATKAALPRCLPNGHAACRDVIHSE
jgi:hypothetical protein